VAALDILYFLDGQAERRSRLEAVKQAFVARGMITPAQAWPEFFAAEEGDGDAFPSAGSDMSGFVLEEATPESFAADMAALVEASKQVVIREPSPPPGEEHAYVPDMEWT